MKQFAKVPQVMKDQRRWCVWRQGASKTPGAKDRKFPMQVITDPNAWLTFEEAVAEYDKGACHGIGYQMLGSPEVIGIDLDNCIDPDHAEGERLRPADRPGSPRELRRERRPAGRASASSSLAHPTRQG